MQENDNSESGSLRPQYPGDDTRRTSRKEFAGWYSYSWAAEVFTVCAMGSFLPITLEQMARDSGVLLSDKMTPCSATWKTFGGFERLHYLFDDPGYSQHAVPSARQCVVYILGAEVNTASFAMYTFSVSVFIQSILIISMSGAADHGTYRKMLLVLFAFIGSTSTMLFIVVSPKVYYLGGLLAIIANTCFGASFVLLNSFLPLLVRHHSALSHESNDDDLVSTSSTPGTTTPGNGLPAGVRYASSHGDTSSLLRSNIAGDRISMAQLTPATSTYVSQELCLSTKISSYGIGIGYIGAVILQIVCILVVVRMNQTTFSLRIALFLIGMWWSTFTIPAAVWLRARPGPPLPPAHDGKQYRSWIGYMGYAWKSLGRSVMKARHLKDVMLFLGAWFLLSDGIATVSGTAVLFAKTQLDMQPAALGLINVVAVGSGVIGAFSWSYVSRLFHLQASQTIVVCIVLFELVPLYGLLGFIPAVKRLGIGLQQPWEMFPLSAVYGLVMGGLSSYCRSFFGELIPPGHEAAFYALYSVTDKGSSVFGPAVVGAVTDRCGEIRPAFVFLAILILLPLPLMLLVDADRGKADALRLAADLTGGHDTPRLGYGTLPNVQYADENETNN